MGYLSAETSGDTSASTIFRVDGLVAVISGGGSGLGALMAKILVENGAAKVFIIGRRAHVLEETAKSSPNIIPVQGDVTSKESLTNIVSKIKETTNYVNLVIANAGTMGPSPFPGPDANLAEFVKAHWAVPMEDFNATYDLNTTSVFYTTLAFLELLDAGNKESNMGIFNKSQVIVVSTVAAFARVAPYAYATSKMAVTHMAKMLSTTLVPYDIRVNSLNPGFFETELAAPLLGGLKLPNAPPGKNYPKEFIPSERVGIDEDLAGPLLYLVSRGGAFSNGSVTIFDGGKIGIEKATW